MTVDAKSHIELFLKILSNLSYRMFLSTVAYCLKSGNVVLA